MLSQWHHHHNHTRDFTIQSYENCEFFMGDAASEPGVMHVLCSNHGGGQPHWVTRTNSTALEWTYVNTISNTLPQPSNATFNNHWGARAKALKKLRSKQELEPIATVRPLMKK